MLNDPELGGYGFLVMTPPPTALNPSPSGLRSYLTHSTGEANEGVGWETKKKEKKRGRRVL